MEFINYFAAVFTPFNFSILCLGTIGGLILGALPGLSPTMAVALLIPFTFHMEPASGLILLGAAYTATVAGGAVSAILLKIPGAPANVATVLDGHEMARQGSAAKALQLCFVSSGIGGVLGIFVLIFFTPLLAQWALAFGPSHLFWLAIVGITIIASLGSDSLAKGLISGAIGLWISTIGFDQIQGVERFTFSDHLTGGVNIIAALVGLFAVPKVLQTLEKKSRIAEVLVVKSHSIWQAVRLTFSRGRAIFIGSVVGIIVGLIPGAGGQIAGLVSYDQTRKWSPHPDNFGKGEPDGIIAAETANNAMVGPSLVPLLTLSIPGSPTAAVLLGGLLIHGIFPGSDLFEIYPEVTWTFINSLLIGQILMVVFGLLLARVAAKVIRVSDNYLAAGVMVLAVFGTYSVQHSYSDVLVMMALGTGMFILAKFGYTAAPIVLGVILGPIAERNFLQGRIIANAGDGMVPYFFSGWLNAALILLIVLSIGSSLWYAWRHRLPKQGGQAGQGADSAMPSPSVSWGDWGLLVFAASLVVVSFGVKDSVPYLFPQIIAVTMLLLCVLHIAGIISRGLGGSGGSGNSGGIAGGLSAVLPFASLNWQTVARPLPAFLVIFIYALIAERLGFYITAGLAFCTIVLVGGGGGGTNKVSRRNVAVAAGLAVVAVLVLYGLFSLLLRVQTPKGILF